MSNEKPNIVLLMTDEQKLRTIQTYGNNILNFQFQDFMAENGIIFENAYANSPICTPSRASIMTGVYPIVHQVTCHQNRVPWNLPQLSELLQKEGYYTLACGHYEANRNLNRGWHEQVSEQESGIIRKTWKEWANMGRKDVGWSSGPMNICPEEGLAAKLTDRAIGMLDNAKASGAPFFFYMAYLEPHPPYFAPKEYYSLYEPEKVELPFVGEGHNKPKWQYQVMKECKTKEASELDIKKVIATYYGKVAYVNDQMQRLYHAMEERNMINNTWFILVSDHGDYTGEKGMFNKTESLYDCLLHVPLIVCPPPNISFKRGKRVKEIVELIDLFPTILNIANIEVPKYIQGYNLVEWSLDNSQEPLRKCTFAQVGDYHGPLKTTFPAGAPETGRRKSLLQGARTTNYSYIYDPDYGDEAYSLYNDPYELSNLLTSNISRPPKEILELKQNIKKLEKESIKLRNELKIVPGDRGFWDLGWHY